MIMMKEKKVVGKWMLLVFQEDIISFINKWSVLKCFKEIGEKENQWDGLGIDFVVTDKLLTWSRN
jgi:hypothetical protein